MKVKEIKVINMQHNRLLQFLPLVGIFLFVCLGTVQAQGDRLPVREYTNPEEIVTFDRRTPFTRALDVINEFAQKYRNKIILDRTNTQESLGISVPAMHWMDALELILRVKELQLVEKKDFYEIVVPESQSTTANVSSSGGGGSAGGNGEGPLATTNTKEVRINAIFFEGNRRALQEIGVDWSTISEGTPADVTDATEGVNVPSSEFDSPFVQVNSEGASNVSQRVFDAVVNFGEIGNTGISVQSLFSAFEAENLGEILSSPNVKVMDGQEGTIQVGQDFSVKQRDFSGNVVEEFFSVGTILEVTPSIIEQNDTTFVHLNIRAERSSAQPDPVSTVINKQEAETQALLLDGQATVIAGLYRTEKSQVRRGIPILKDLPPWFFGLRYLFGYTSDDYLMRELIILLQVDIEPTIPERIAEGVETNRFKELQNERRRIREGIEQGDKIFRGKDVAGKLDLQKGDKDKFSEEDSMASEEKSSDSKEKSQKPEGKMAEDKKVEPEPSEESTQNEQENVITDPEMADRKVELNLGGTPNEEEQPTDNQNMENTESSEQKQPTENKEEEKPKEKPQPGASYYIIGGSFTVDANARTLRDQLRGEGFNAVLLNRANSDMTYVAYRSYQSLSSAQSGLADIQQNQNTDAWLYKAK